MGYAVALWSRIDSELGAILAYMLKGDARPPIAMYAALNSSQAKNDALEAAARVSLTHEDLQLFNAVMVLVKRAEAKRNKLAHWIWGESPELKDALLLIDPDAILEHQSKVKDFLKSVRSLAEILAVESVPAIDIKKAFVYREREFNEIIIEFANVWALTVRLSSYLATKIAAKLDSRSAT